MEVVLDTNAYSDWVRLGAWRREMEEAARVWVPAIVLGELFHGFHGGERFKENERVLGEFLRHDPVVVLKVAEEVARVFGEFVDFLQKRGTPLPSNDIWIAAGAVVKGAVLLTRDRHFEKLPQVRVAIEG